MQALLESEKAQAVEFKLFKKMAYGRRIRLILCFFAMGLLLQLLIVWWLGLPFVFSGVLLTLCNGATNKPTKGRFGAWENVTLEQFRKAQEMFEKTARWGRDRYALGSGIGFLFFILLLGGLLGIGLLLFSSAGEANSCYALVSDGILVLLLVFATGGRHPWEPEGLRIKIEPLLNVCDHLNSYRDAGIEIAPMLELQGKGEKKIPRDCKLMLKLKGAPKEFMGIQVQTSLNNVQGTSYPYMYCVLLAKPHSGLVAKAAPLLKEAAEKLGFFANANDKKNPDLLKKRYLSEVAEAEVQRDVELIVIRQVTLGTGYYTKPIDQIRVLTTAIHLAKRIYGL